MFPFHPSIKCFATRLEKNQSTLDKMPHNCFYRPLSHTVADLVQSSDLAQAYLSMHTDVVHNASLVLCPHYCRVGLNGEGYLLRGQAKTQSVLDFLKT